MQTSRICEMCNKEHNGSYGSGRFCSQACSRKFSTHAKRKEINAKVSESLSYLEVRHCLHCGKRLEIHSRKSTQQYCNRHAQLDPILRERASKRMIEKIISGEMKKFGKSTKCEFNFNGNRIQCDSKLEWYCLKYILKTYKVSSIERCNFHLTYTDINGTNRRFVPDFKVSTESGIMIIECKYHKVCKTINERWKNYIENSELKKQALIHFCQLLNYQWLWFTNLTDPEYKRSHQLRGTELFENL